MSLGNSFDLLYSILTSLLRWKEDQKATVCEVHRDSVLLSTQKNKKNHGERSVAYISVLKQGLFQAAVTRRTSIKENCFLFTFAMNMRLLS